MKTCPNCNASVSDTSKFCNKCGYNFEKKAELFINREFCVNCGAEMPNDSVFCPECGCNIEEQKQAAKEAEQKRKEIEEKTKNDSVIENGVLKRYNGSETNVIIPDTVTEISKDAFAGRESLISIEIPNSVTTIGEDAFNCKNLVEIIVHKENKHYLSDNGVLYTKDKKTLVCYPNGKSEKHFSIPNSVTTIGERAFSKCKNLKTIKIPNSVTTIGVCAFSECKNLKTIKIPKSVTTIGEYAFSECSEIIVHKNNEHYLSDNGVLYTKDKKTLVCYPAGKSEICFSIPEEVTTIGEYAFYKCKNLTSIEIPKSVTTIGKSAFCGCWNLESIEIPNSVTIIGKDAFLYCGRVSVKISWQFKYREDLGFGSNAEVVYY